MACDCNKTYSIGMGCCVPTLAPADNFYTKYQTEKKIEEAVSGLTGITGCCITPEEVDEKISAATDDMATQEWVENKGYITGVDLSNYATKAEIPIVPTSNTAFTNDAGYLTEHQPIKTINGQSLIGTGDIEIGTGGTIDLSNYYTTAQTVNLVESAVTRVEGEIPTVPTSNTAFTNDAGYLTEHQSLSGYATEQWVLDKHYITGVDLSDYITYDSIPDLGELATKEWVINKNYATNSELIQYITNLQQQIDSLKQQISGCCGDTGETLTRWMVMTGDSNYTCSGTTKMTKEEEQQSTDGGNTWSSTGNYRTGSTVLEEDCVACGYGDCQYCCEVKLSGDSTVYTPKTWVGYYNGVLNRSTTNQGFFETNDETITHMTFDECVKKVESNAFYIAGFTAVEYIDIPATVTEIGHSAFNIGTSSHFTTMVVRATTPPALSSYEDNLDSHGTEGATFKSGGRNLKIYVPDAVVNTYKTTPRWSNYAEIIYPISQLS